MWGDSVTFGYVRLLTFLLIAAFAATAGAQEGSHTEEGAYDEDNASFVESRDIPAAIAYGGESYFFFGVGRDDVRDNNETHSPATAFQLEGAWRELFHVEFRSLGDTVLRMRPRGTLEVSLDADVFVGAGLALEVFPLGGPVFFEVNFTPGMLRRPDEFFPVEFRTQFGVGYLFDNGHSLTLTASHKSNNKWGPEHSSVEALFLRYGVPFSTFGD